MENILDDTLIFILGVALSLIILGVFALLNNYLENKSKYKSLKQTHYYNLILNQNKNKRNKINA
jgi:hypothetical protein